MIDPEVELLLTLSQAAKRVPRLGKKHVHSSTVFRWCRKGLHGVHLEYIRIGNRIVTSVEALTRFFNALAAADPVASQFQIAPPQESVPTTADRAAAVSQAFERLEREGM